MAGTGSKIKSAWAFKQNCKNSGLELLRVQTKQPVNIPEIWTGWWFEPAGGTETLVIQDTFHSHSVDNITLTQTYVLVVGDCNHTQSVDNISLTQVYNLSVADVFHGQAVDNVVLVQVYGLFISDCTHSQTVDNIILAQIYTLQVADTHHEQYVDDIIILTVEWWMEFVKIPTELVEKYTQKKMIWFWGIDVRESVYDGFVLPEFIINALQTTPAVKDLPETLEVLEELEELETEFLTNYDFA